MISNDSSNDLEINLQSRRAISSTYIAIYSYTLFVFYMDFHWFFIPGPAIPAGAASSPWHLRPGCASTVPASSA